MAPFFQSAKVRLGCVSFGTQPASSFEFYSFIALYDHEGVSMLLTGVNMTQVRRGSGRMKRSQSLPGRTKGRHGGQKANQSISARARLASTVLF